MQKTNKFELNKWESTDAIRMETFNNNIEKLETILTGMPQFKVGSYTGNGKSGKSNYNLLTFDFQPKFLLILNNRGEIYERVEVINGMDRAYVYTSFMGGDYDEPVYFAWANKAITWYSSNYVYQLNRSNTTYYYLALGEYGSNIGISEPSKY